MSNQKVKSNLTTYYRKWYKYQPATIRAAILGGVFAIVAAFLSFICTLIIESGPQPIIMVSPMLTDTPMLTSTPTDIPQDVTPIILRGHTGKVHNAVISKDGQQIATASDDGTIQIFDSNGNFVKRLTGHTDVVYVAVWSVNKRYLISASKDKTARIWDNSGKKPPIILQHQVSVLSAIPDSEGRKVATADVAGGIRIWDATTGAKLHDLQVDGAEVQTLGFSADGRYIASGNRDGNVILWDALKGEKISTLTGHLDPVISVTFNPNFDHPMLASADESGGVALWDIPTRRRLGPTLGGRSSSVWSLYFSSNGQYLLSGSVDGTAIV